MTVDVTVLRRVEAAYPARLRELHDPPPALHLAGRRRELLAWDGPALAIVGARRASEPGLRLAGEIARAAASRGVLIVSGLALGIDAAAHRGALEADGSTVAVMGCGPDVAYPRTNRRLHEAILERGIVLSEYSAGTEPAPWRF